MNIYKAHTALLKMKAAYRKMVNALGKDSMLSENLIRVGVLDIPCALAWHTMDYYNSTYFDDESVVDPVKLRKHCKNDCETNFDPADMHEAFIKVYGGKIDNVKLQSIAHTLRDRYLIRSIGPRASKATVVVNDTWNGSLGGRVTAIVNIERLIGVVNTRSLPPLHDEEQRDSIEKMFYRISPRDKHSFVGHHSFDSIYLYNNGRMDVVFKDKGIVDALMLLVNNDDLESYPLKTSAIIEPLEGSPVIKTDRLVSI